MFISVGKINHESLIGLVAWSICQNVQFQLTLSPNVSRKFIALMNSNTLSFI